MSEIESIVAKLLQRASKACYWKEDAEDRAAKADTVELREMWQSAAERHESYETLWNEAVAIVRGERP